MLTSINRSLFMKIYIVINDFSINFIKSRYLEIYYVPPKTAIHKGFREVVRLGVDDYKKLRMFNRAQCILKNIGAVFV